MEPSNPKNKRNNKPILQAEIDRLGEDLTGKAKVGKKTYSIRYAKPGDHVEFQFFGRGKSQRIHVHSIQRKEPLALHAQCPYFGTCGGCSGQHIPYEEQFSLKTNRLVHLYRNHWDLEPTLAPAKETYHYRNRMDFAISPNGCGLREAGNFKNIIDIQNCSIQSHWANQEWNQIRKYIQENPHLPRDRKKGSGYLKFVTLRYGFYTEDNLIIFTFCEEWKGSIEEKKLEEWLLQKSNAKNIVFCYNPSLREVSASGDFRVIKGEKYYKERIYGIEFQVPFDSFFQPNPIQFYFILNYFKEWIQKIQSLELLDFFCGSGFFSLIFGNDFEKILGFDSSEVSIQTAKKLIEETYPNKKIYFHPLDLHQRNTKRQINYYVKQAGFQLNQCLLILDPPRSGLGHSLLEWIEESNVGWIAYVSCNPHKQWEELMTTLGKYYWPRALLLTDPYPHTPHLESLLILQRK